MLPQKIERPFAPKISDAVCPRQKFRIAFAPRIPEAVCPGAADKKSRARLPRKNFRPRLPRRKKVSFAPCNRI